MRNVPTDLDRLDEEYRDSQDRLGAAIEVGDQDAIADIRADAGNLSVTDADGVRWRVHAPTQSGTVAPYYRFHYRYWGARGDGELRPMSRSRFAPAPSLARRYGERVGTKGWLAAVIRNAEPLGYVGGVAVAAGLWFLLGDIVGSLPGWAILVGMVVLAAGLWVATAWLAGASYREGIRLAQVTRAAAVGVTAAVPWVGTVDATWITSTGRLAFTAYVLTIVAVLSYIRVLSILTFSIGLGGWIVALGATSMILVEEAFDGAFDFFGAQPGILIAIAVAFPIATAFGAVRWIPATVVVLGACASFVIFVSAGEDASNGDAFWTIVMGAGTAMSVFLSRRYLRRAMRRFHLWTAVGVAVATVLVALAKAPWDVIEAIFEWLGDIPLPVLLIGAGSLLLIGVSWVIRLAVRRVASIPDADTTDARRSRTEDTSSG